MATETEKTTTTDYEDTKNTLAQVFHEAFSKRDLAPNWHHTSIKYKAAVLAGIEAMLKHMQQKPVR